MVLHRFAGTDEDWRQNYVGYKTVCGVFTYYTELTRDDDNVTCVQCSQVIAQRRGPAN